MTAIQAVFTATITVVAVAIGLAIAGVASLAGHGWALITAGALIGPTAAMVGWLVLREGSAP